MKKASCARHSPLNKIPTGISRNQTFPKSTVELLFLSHYNNSILSRQDFFNIFSKRIIFFSVVLFSTLLFPHSLSFSEEPVTVKGKTYGPEYFFPISGDISGQAAPGVQSVFVNGKRVKVDSSLNFKSAVKLKKGEKYLTIETRYKGLNFIKKYLVIRHPKVKKTFTIAVPQKEFKEIVEKKEPVVVEEKVLPVKKGKAGHKRKREIAKVTLYNMKQLAKTTPKQKVTTIKFEFVAELARGRFLIVEQADGKYFALLYRPKDKVWLPLHELSLEAFQKILEKDTTH
jgi:hypothetical protein